MALVPYDYSNENIKTDWTLIIGLIICFSFGVGCMWLVMGVKPHQRTYTVNPDATYENITWAGERAISLPDGRLIILPENNTCVYEEIK